MLAAAHKAIRGGTAIGEVITPEWGASALGLKDEAHLNYSQTWRYHTRAMMVLAAKGQEARCKHCEPKGEDDLAPLAKQAEDGNDEAKLKLELAIASSIGSGNSWGYVSVQLGNDGTANSAWPESKVRSTFQRQAGVQHKGMRPAHKGGRWIAAREDLYREEYGAGTREDGVFRKPGQPLPTTTHPQQATDEQKLAAAKALKARKQAHERKLASIKAEWAKLIKG
jgi:hypothetical protein